MCNHVTDCGQSSGLQYRTDVASMGPTGLTLLDISRATGEKQIIDGHLRSRQVKITMTG